MRLERLTKGQVEDIYKNKMTVDFPKSELKPLDAILKAIDNDIYEPLGQQQNEDFDKLWDLYQEFYRIVLPKEMFDKNIVRM